MSDDAAPAGPAGDEDAAAPVRETPAAVAPPHPAREAAAPMPAWVPATIVAGAVLLLLGLIVGRIRAPGASELADSVGDLASVSMGLGLVSLLVGTFFHLLEGRDLPAAIEGLATSAATLVLYLLSWATLLALLAGTEADAFFVAPTGLEGRAAKGLAVAGLLVFVGGFAGCFRWTARILWPHFRAGVALNVLAMVHLIVLLLGAVSALNLKFTARVLGGGLDLTSTRQFSLGDRTLRLLESVEGKLDVAVVDYSAARGGASRVTDRVNDLLREYAARCPAMTVHRLDPLRKEDETRRRLEETGLRSVLVTATGEDDIVAFAYTPPGERGVPKTKIVPVDVEFTDESALGNRRFRGESILTNAIHEVVFARRKVYFTEGHGERPRAAQGLTGVSLLAEALRGDNLTVDGLDLARTASVPKDADLLLVVGPTAPFRPAEAEALRRYLGDGGAVVLLLDMPTSGTGPVPPLGIEELLAAYGIEARRDAVIVSWAAETTLQGLQHTPIPEVLAGAEEVTSHAAMEALSRTTSRMSFPGSVPVFRAKTPPDSVQVKELILAPRDVQGRKPFGALVGTVRPQGRLIQPAEGDIVDMRLPVAVAAERKPPGGVGAGGRLVVFGDTDFISDSILPNVPLNRTLALNVVSWAVRRDFIAIDPKSLETDIVTLRPVDREFAFWVAVVALPLITLGVAVGVWWGRRR